MKKKGAVEIMNNGVLFLTVEQGGEMEYNQFESDDELEIFAFKNGIKLIRGIKDE